MDENKQQNYLMLGLIVVFLLGCVVGFAVGEYYINSLWTDYHNFYEKKINDSCICKNLNSEDKTKWILKN